MTPKRMNHILIGSLALLCIGGIFILYFANQKLTAIAEETATLSADIEVTKKQIKTYNATRIKVESLGYVDELARKVLPDTQDQSVVVAELSAFAQRNELQVAGIEFIEVAKDTKGTKPKKSSKKDEKSSTPKGVEVLPVLIKFTDAPYDNLLNFLRNAEGNQRKMQITSINLEPDEEQREIMSEVSVALNLYVKAGSSEGKK